jgi:hypothetical protein
MAQEFSPLIVTTIATTVNGLVNATIRDILNEQRGDMESMINRALDERLGGTGRFLLGESPELLRLCVWLFFNILLPWWQKREEKKSRRPWKRL